MTLLAEAVLQSTACQCDDQQDKKFLISVEQALELIDAHITTIAQTEILPLARSVGRVLSAPVRAKSSAPPFNNSAMDGYAVNCHGMKNGRHWTFKVNDRIAAGDDKPVRLTLGTAVRIFTGAPVPEGATAVVAQENVKVMGKTIHLSSAPQKGENIRFAGEDMVEGTTVLTEGAVLQARHIVCAAAAGSANLSVRRQLRVAIVTTGNELKGTGQSRSGAEIWDINSPMLAAELAQPFVELVTVEVGADNPYVLKKQMSRLAATSDLVVTTGGISVGEEDHVKSVIKALNGSILFSGVRLKPGKPVSFGKIGSAFWLGLPGNPLSAFVTWHLFGKPVLSNLTGADQPRWRTRTAISNVCFHRHPGRAEYRPATVIAQLDGRDVLDFPAAVHSGRVGALATATGLACIPAGLTELNQGDFVEFLPFSA